MTEILARSEFKAMFSVGPRFRAGWRKCKRRSDGTMFAVKAYNKSKMSEEELQRRKKMINIWRKLSHPNITNLHYFLHDLSRAQILLIADICESNDLSDRLLDPDGRISILSGVPTKALSEKQARIVFYGICSALEYLHSKCIVHRQISNSTIEFCSQSYHSVKLGNFELSNCRSDGQFSTPCGTPTYAAPEILRKEVYGTKVDMWSIGVILYEMLCGYSPFSMDIDQNLTRLYADIKAGNYYEMPQNISIEGKDLITKLLQTDPSQRLSAKMALAHPWVFATEKKEKMRKLICGYVGHISDCNRWMSAEVMSMICKYSVYMFLFIDEVFTQESDEESDFAPV